MRLELHLADERSAVDVEHLVNLRTLRLWPGGLGKLRLQSDYGYRRRTSRWTHLSFVWDGTNYQTSASDRFLTELAATEPERAHSQALSREPDQVSVNGVTGYLTQADTPTQEFLAASGLVLSRKTTVAQLAEIMRKGLLPALFDRYSDARLCYVEVGTEASQRLQDIVVLHLYERQNRDEVNRALLDAGFFPQVQGFRPLPDLFLVVGGGVSANRLFARRLAGLTFP